MSNKSGAKSINSTVVSLLSELASHSCTSLFEAYGVSLRSIDSAALPSRPITLSAVVGFGGRGIQGTCVLAASDEPIEQTNQVDVPLREWVAELGNQLVGRIRNRLLSVGVEVYASTPVVLRSEHLAPLPRRDLLPIAFASPTGEVFVWIDLETSPDFQFGTPAEALGEGEEIVF
jgi:CheY-specific phosphatase CheX